MSSVNSSVASKAEGVVTKRKRAPLSEEKKAEMKAKRELSKANKLADSARAVQEVATAIKKEKGGSQKPTTPPVPETVKVKTPRGKKQKVESIETTTSESVTSDLTYKGDQGVNQQQLMEFLSALGGVITVLSKQGGQLKLESWTNSVETEQAIQD